MGRVEHNALLNCQAGTPSLRTVSGESVDGHSHIKDLTAKTDTIMTPEALSSNVIAW